MQQVSEAIAGREKLPDNAVAVTIDDGYRDFLLNAYPIFYEFQIPTTVYLVSDFLDRRDWNWWDKIQYALQNTAESQFELNVNGDKRILAVQQGQAHEQMHKVAQELKTMTNARRQGEIARMMEQLRIDLPSSAPKWCEPMTWDEVKQLARTNVEFGAHTKTHPILSTVSGKRELEDEIRGSQKRVEKELDRPVLHFCYPNGREQDIGAEALQVTRESGFRTAVTTLPGTNRIGAKTDAFQLKRLGSEPSLPDYYFTELMAGVRTS